MRESAGLRRVVIGRAYQSLSWRLANVRPSADSIDRFDFMAVCQLLGSGSGRVEVGAQVSRDPVGSRGAGWGDLVQQHEVVDQAWLAA
jgi:hypothetical protein